MLVAAVMEREEVPQVGREFASNAVSAVAICALEAGGAKKLRKALFEAVPQAT